MLKFTLSIQNSQFKMNSQISYRRFGFGVNPMKKLLYLNFGATLVFMWVKDLSSPVLPSNI